MSRIIGLAGKKGSGKDTVAGILLGLGYHLHDHADPIRKAFDCVVGEHNSVYRVERKLKEANVPGFTFSYRQFAEAFGSGGMMGKLNPEWTLAAAEQACFSGKKVCFTNLRVVDELTHAQQVCKAEIWWIDRPNNPYDDGSQALTEQDLSAYADVIIPNNRGLDELANYVRSRI
jgi:hypothetical protein